MPKLMPNFPSQHRMTRPPLLPTPTMQAPRYIRNVSMSSDNSNRPDELESSEMDMEMSDDDGSGLDAKMGN